MKFLKCNLVIVALVSALTFGCADDEPLEVTRLPRLPSAMDPLLTANVNDEVRRLSTDLASGMRASGRRLAVSTYPRVEGYVDSGDTTRASRLLEESLTSAARQSGNYLVGRTSLTSVINSLEREGLGGNIEAFRVRLLENALADVMVVPTYSQSRRGIEMSAIAIEASTGNALSSAGPVTLPIGNAFDEWRGRRIRLNQCYERRQSSCILDCTRNYNYGRSQCINVLCSPESDTNMSMWRRVCNYTGGED